MIMHIVTIGTYDKDTKKLEHDVSDIQSLVNNYIAQHIGNGTVYSADGIYRHQDGCTVREPSIRVEICDVDPAAVMEFIHWAKKTLNQECVMYEQREENIKFI